MRPDRDEIVLAAGGSDQLRRFVFVLGNDAPIFAELHVAARLRAAVVTCRAVRIEADQSRQSSFTAIYLPNDFLIVDSLEELARDGNTRAIATHRELVEEAVGNELQ